MKIDNARSRMLVIMDELERQPHVYGQSDCIMRVGRTSAAQVHEEKRSEILAMLEKYRGRYSTLAGAYRVLREDGLTPLSLVGHFFEEIEPVTAEDGDIGAIKQDGRNWGFGVIVGAHLYVAGATGTAILPRSDAQKAFRVE